MLGKKLVEPPFIPEIDGEKDLRYVDEDFLHDSLAEDQIM